MKKYVLKQSASFKPSVGMSDACTIQQKINSANVQKAVRRKYGEYGLQRALEASRKAALGQHWVQKRRAQHASFCLLVGSYALLIGVLVISGAAKFPV